MAHPILNVTVHPLHRVCRATRTATTLELEKEAHCHASGTKPLSSEEPCYVVGRLGTRKKKAQGDDGKGDRKFLRSSHRPLRVKYFFSLLWLPCTTFLNRTFVDSD